MAGLAGAPGGLCETWRASAGPGARPPAAVRTQRLPRLHVPGEDPRVAVRVSGRRNLRALHESGVSRPRAILDVRDLRHAPRPSHPGPDAEQRGRAQVPAEPEPSRCHAQSGLTLSFFSPWSCLPTFTEEIPDALQSCGSSLTTYPRPSAETPTPKVKREARPSSCARGWLSRSS